MARPADVVQRRYGRAVEIAVVRRVLEKRPFANQSFELVPADEVVVDTVDLTWSRRASRVRHRVSKIGVELEQPFDHRVLADAGRPRDDDQQGSLRRGRQSRVSPPGRALRAWPTSPQAGRLAQNASKSGGGATSKLNSTRVRG